MLGTRTLGSFFSLMRYIRVSSFHKVNAYHVHASLHLRELVFMFDLFLSKTRSLDSGYRECLKLMYLRKYVNFFFLVFSSHLSNSKEAWEKRVSHWCDGSVIKKAEQRMR